MKRTNFKVSSGKQNSISSRYLHIRTRKHLDLIQIHDEALINIKKTNQNAHVQMSNS